MVEIRASLATLGFLENPDEHLTTGQHVALDVFDDDLDHAVRAFQQRRGLLVDGIVGEATVDFIAQFKVDIALIGISAIEADGTLRDFDYREVTVARAIIEHSREVWLAADHSKFNRPAMVELARLDQIDVLYTDAEPPEPFPALLAEAGVTCQVAAP